MKISAAGKTSHLASPLDGAFHYRSHVGVCEGFRDEPCQHSCPPNALSEGFPDFLQLLVHALNPCALDVSSLRYDASLDFTFNKLQLIVSSSQKITLLIESHGTCWWRRDKVMTPTCEWWFFLHIIPHNGLKTHLRNMNLILLGKLSHAWAGKSQRNHKNME